MNMIEDGSMEPSGLSCTPRERAYLSSFDSSDMMPELMLGVVKDDG